MLNTLFSNFFFMFSTNVEMLIGELHFQAYVQQLENSRLKLTQLEQELQRARQQGVFISSSGDQAHSTTGNGELCLNLSIQRVIFWCNLSIDLISYTSSILDLCT